MKTIKQKARAYDEAIDKLRNLHDNYDNVSTLIDIKEELEHIFPELRESEDERIRNEIKDVFYSLGEGKIPVSINFAAIFDWLEKQGKEECALKSSKDEDVHKFMQYIEKQAKAYEFNLPNRSYDIYAFAKDILVWLEKQGDHKLAWSEEDEQYLLVCKNALAKYQTTDKWDANIIYNWLKNKLQK